YKSFICVVNEINSLEFFFRYKWTNVSKNHFKTTEFCDFDQQQKMHQRAGCFFKKLEKQALNAQLMKLFFHFTLPNRCT
ncbi:hypothetical protein, partial [Klebsiella michiganensis]|uniref:hypothetical protein n=1 Tax=Klebsiella michiganensis TaxID=1134687 RepID=UPI001BB019FC